MIAEYEANPHPDGEDRFIRLEAWLLVLCEKVFPGLVKPVPGAVPEPRPDAPNPEQLEIADDPSSAWTTGRRRPRKR